MKKFLENMKEETPKVNACLLEIKKKSDEEGAENVAKWSHMMEEKMLDSKRVVVFLSPNFLLSKECIDNYNLALCLSRKLNNSLLAPVYLNSMPYVPTYLGMTQWIDCRDEVNMRLSYKLPNTEIYVGQCIFNCLKTYGTTFIQFLYTVCNFFSGILSR